MSSYLVERIVAAGNIDVRLQTEVVGAHGEDHLETITLADRAAGTEEEVATDRMFIFIGAQPRTDWLGAEVARDDKGFVITGHDLTASVVKPGWSQRATFGWRRASRESSPPGTCGWTP